jgi:hypothetical protein
MSHTSTSGKLYCKTYSMQQYFLFIKGLWSYGSWIYNYLCNQQSDSSGFAEAEMPEPPVIQKVRNKLKLQNPDQKFGLGLCCFTSLSTIFQIYCGIHCTLSILPMDPRSENIYFIYYKKMSP